MEPEKHDSPFQRKKQHASQQINPSPPTAARPQHRTIPRRAPSIRYANRRIHTKIRTATPAAIAPTTEVPLPPAKARQASSRTIPVDGRPGSTLTVQDVPDQTHGMKRHTQFQSPPPPSDWKRRYRKISTSRRWKRSPTIWRHGEPVPMRNVANTMRRSRGWRHPEPD